MTIDVQKNKSWKTVATFSTYEEADLRRKQLLDIYEQVKVKRGVSDGEVFRVKAWNSVPLKSKKSKKKVRKNDNKKIRAGQAR
jgi:hypothetical protein